METKSPLSSSQKHWHLSQARPIQRKFSLHNSPPSTITLVPQQDILELIFPNCRLSIGILTKYHTETISLELQNWPTSLLNIRSTE